MTSEATPIPRIHWQNGGPTPLPEDLAEQFRTATTRFLKPEEVVKPEADPASRQETVNEETADEPPITAGVEALPDAEQSDGDAGKPVEPVADTESVADAETETAEAVDPDQAMDLIRGLIESEEPVASAEPVSDRQSAEPATEPAAQPKMTRAQDWSDLQTDASDDEAGDDTEAEAAPAPALRPAYDPLARVRTKSGIVTHRPVAPAESAAPAGEADPFAGTLDGTDTETRPLPVEDPRPRRENARIKDPEAIAKRTRRGWNLCIIALLTAIPVAFFTLSPVSTAETPAYYAAAAKCGLGEMLVAAGAEESRDALIAEGECKPSEAEMARSREKARSGSAFKKVERTRTSGGIKFQRP